MSEHDSLDGTRLTVYNIISSSNCKVLHVKRIYCGIKQVQFGLRSLIEDTGSTIGSVY